jgi:hypothetical protein
MRLRRERNESLAAVLGKTVNEIQLALTGLRTELLDAATSYGLMRAATNGDAEQLDAWREWLIYTRRMDAWLKGAISKSEMRQKLADASELSAQLFQERIQESISENWWHRLECLAEAARSVEELGRPDYEAYPLNEIPGQTPHGVALLGAIEDSLTLELDPTAENQAVRATADEIHELLVAARAERVWEYMEPDGEKHRGPGRRPPAQSAEVDTAEFGEFVKALLATAAHAVDFYRRLGPDGRELTDREQQGAREHLVTNASWLRRTGARQPLLAEVLAGLGRPIDLERMLQGWRRIQRSLVLALSESPDLRQRAYPPNAPMTTDEHSSHT